MLFMFNWLNALYMQASFWAWVITIIEIIVLINSVIGFIVVISWIVKLLKPKYPKVSKSGLTREEQEFMYGKKR